MTHPHQSVGALAGWLYDPFTETDDLALSEAVAYLDNAHVTSSSELGLYAVSPIEASVVAHEALTRACDTRNGTGIDKESACSSRCASASKGPKNGSADRELPSVAVEQEATCAAQWLLNLPTAEQMKNEKLRAKNRRNQQAYRARMKVRSG
jgi:hypothetical protein